MTNDWTQMEPQIQDTNTIASSEPTPPKQTKKPAVWIVAVVALVLLIASQVAMIQRIAKLEQKADPESTELQSEVEVNTDETRLFAAPDDLDALIKKARKVMSTTDASTAKSYTPNDKKMYGGKARKK